MKQALRWGRLREGMAWGGDGLGREGGLERAKRKEVKVTARNGSQGAAQLSQQEFSDRGEHIECAGLGAGAQSMLVSWVLSYHPRPECKHQNNSGQRSMKSQQAGHVLLPASQSGCLQ